MEVESDARKLIFPDQPSSFFGGDVKILSQHSSMISIRYCPFDEYDDFSMYVKEEEGLCLSAPIIQIDDFERFYLVF